MSTSIRITGVTPVLDGEYDLDLARLTNRDWHTIKMVANIRPSEFIDAVQSMDMDLVIAFALIALKRAGKTAQAANDQEIVDVLLDAEAGTIVFASEDEADADPPPIVPSGGDSASVSSGVSSPHGSGLPENLQSRTGNPGLEEPAASAHAT